VSEDNESTVDTDLFTVTRRTFVGASAAIGGAVATSSLLAGCGANAVFNATGRRITDLPITLDKLL
jgi:hypothetical protein